MYGSLRWVDGFISLVFDEKLCKGLTATLFIMQ